MDSFSGLLNNSALVLILCVIYDTFNIHAISKKHLRNFLTGLLVGLIAIAVMLTPWSLKPGVFFDTRWVLLSLCGLFFGIAPTSIAVLIAGSFRLYQGGPGGVVGTIVIVVTACVGLGWRYWKNKYDKPLRWTHLLVFGFLVQLAMLSCMFLMPADMRLPIIYAIAPPILIIYPFLTLLIGLILKRQEDRRATDKELIKEITERKTAETAARKSEAHLRTLIETLPDLVWLKNPDGVYLGCNRKFEQLLGVKESELIGKTDYDFVDKARADFFREKDKGIIAAGKPIRNEYQITYEDDGHTELVEAIETPMRDSGGALIGVLGVGRDITARKADEIAVHKSREEWKKTFNSITDVVSLMDTDLQIVQINQAGCDKLGFEHKEIIGSHCYELFHGSSEPCEGCPLLITRKTLEPQTREVHHEKIKKTFLVSTAPVFDDQGSLTHITHVAKDITERKKLEEKLFQAQKMESIGTLAGGIAHDFNNILSAIIGFAELAKLNIPPDNKAQKDIERVLKSSRRAADLVRHILTFSRKSDHSLEPLAPHFIIKEALKMLQASFPTTIQLQENIDSTCGNILADQTNMYQIVVNLCTNSLHAMEDEKGIIRVSLYRKEISKQEILVELGESPGSFVVLEISDTGHGMDQATMENIFDPYFTTKAVGKGTGLGLSVIHGIIKDYRGFIRVKSAPKKGTTFRVYIPALQQEIFQTASTVEVEEPLPTGTERILVVDDESMIVALNKTVLERLGYSVMATTKSLEALKLIQDDPDKFDLIITDQTMPDLTGVELAQNVLKTNHTIPIILCTGYSSVISEKDALSVGIKNHIKKPINRKALANLVRKVIDENRSCQP